MRSISIDELPAAIGPVRVDFDGLPLDVSYKPGSRPILFVIFHGAVDQKTRPLPFFQAHFSAAFGAHQLSMSDPTLTRSPDLKTGWYAGTDDLPLQQLLPRFFERVSDALSVKRVVYFGGSAGGFAALFYSHAHPGSLALAANPQTTLHSYLPGPVTTYRETCWPGLAGNGDLDERICTNVADRYAESMPNFVCLLNSSGDRFHLFNQTLEFVGRLKPEARNRLVFHSDFYGVLGHSGSIPPARCTPWLKAAVYARNWYADSILTKLHQFRPEGAARAPVPAAGGSTTDTVDSEDLRLNEAVTAWQLRSEG